MMIFDGLHDIFCCTFPPLVTWGGEVFIGHQSEFDEMVVIGSYPSCRSLIWVVVRKVGKTSQFVFIITYII